MTLRQPNFQTQNVMAATAITLSRIMHTFYAVQMAIFPLITRTYDIRIETTSCRR